MDGAKRTATPMDGGGVFAIGEADGRSTAGVEQVRGSEPEPAQDRGYVFGVARLAECGSGVGVEGRLGHMPRLWRSPAWTVILRTPTPAKRRALVGGYGPVPVAWLRVVAG